MFNLRVTAQNRQHPRVCFIGISHGNYSISRKRSDVTTKSGRLYVKNHQNTVYYETIKLY